MDNVLLSFTGVVVVLGVSVLVLLIAREIVCWYWKVNATLAQLARLEAVLRNIDHSLQRQPPPG